MLSNSIWLVWQYQTRNHSMSRELGVPLYELISSKSGLRRYVELSIKTIQIVKKEQPRVIFCQNPSIVLAFLCTLLFQSKKRKIVVDEHNAGLFPLDGKNRLLNIIANFIVRRADLVIVTNVALYDYCKKIGGEPIIVPDPLPVLPSSEIVTKDEVPFQILFICTWASDEPIQEVMEACSHFSENEIKVLVTGNPKGMSQNDAPACVQLTGFISKEDYFNYLISSDAVVVLTKRENCLNCGAYEAVSAEKPGILSNTEALRAYFSNGFLYVDNTVDDIRQKIIDLKENSDHLEQEVKYLKSELKKKSDNRIDDLKTAVEALF
ncbi:glycosyltransferase [Marinobacter sp. S6332]|uniref:glycosyltransferase n=1 Tax=Marinobacter sp. S6332 TaxID=2926403 RepID=UPI001FF3AB11|nr:glycosyltransferase [Marinobacter sp. S6332]MCK0163990.1 glycosyltransferase [Marinobacter sp. S6332]